MADKRIPELPAIALVNGAFLFVMYDPATDTTYKVNLSQIAPTENPENFNWDPIVVYDTGHVAISDDKLWRSLIDGNVGIVPVEGASWTEVSKSEGSSINYWAAGAYTDVSVVVLSAHNGVDQFYKLVDPLRPYNSLNIATEEAAGDWEPITDLINLLAVVNAAGTITLNFRRGRDRQFNTVAAQGANFIIALSNDQNARRFEYTFEINADIEITFPLSVLMADALFNTSTNKWSNDPGTTGKFLMTGVYNGTNWYISIKGPFT